MPEIKVDTIIRNTFHKGFSRLLVTPNEIVIHGSGGGGTLNWMRGGGRAADYYKGVGLFNYLIEQDGAVWEILPPSRWAYHSCRQSADRRAIGIELVNPGRLNERPYTAKEYESLAWLIGDYLMPPYPIRKIIGHGQAWKEATAGRRTKSCPGAFNWTTLGTALTERGITFSYGTEQLDNVIDVRRCP